MASQLYTIVVLIALIASIFCYVNVNSDSHVYRNITFRRDDSPSPCLVNETVTGEVCPTEREEEIINKITNKGIDGLLDSCSKPNATCNREVHAKSTGCLVASFKVVKCGFNAGIFSHSGKTFPAIIRFSNGNPEIRSDLFPDARGVSIKLLGVEGDQVLSYNKNASNQDFLLMNSERFFIDTSENYLSLLDAIISGNILKYLIRHPVHSYIMSKFMASSTRMINPLYQTYWSAVPYRLGQYYTKYRLTPYDTDLAENEKKHWTSDYLRDNLRLSLSSKKKDSCFAFEILPSVSSKDSIDDSTIEWESKQYYQVGTLCVPWNQTVDADLTGPNEIACENLSFSPWNSLKENRPLGPINRARKNAYEASSTIRHQMSNIDRFEPSCPFDPYRVRGVAEALKNKESCPFSSLHGKNIRNKEHHLTMQ